MKNLGLMILALVQGLLQTTSAGDFVIQFRTEDAAGTITIQQKSILVLEKIG